MDKCLTTVELLHTKFIKPIRTLDRQISINLQEADINIRSAKSNGLWCHILLPVVLLVYSYIDNVSILYKITAGISAGLLFHSALFILFLSTSREAIKEPVFAGCFTSGLIATLFLSVLQQGLVFSLSVGLLSTLLYSALLRLCIVKCTNTFTIGEAMITSQAIILFFLMAVIKFIFEMQSNDEEMEFIGVIVYTILSTVGLIVTVLYLLTESQRTLKTLVYIVVSAATFVLVVLHTILGTNCIVTILNYIFVKEDRYKLFTFWLALLILAICALLVRTKLAVKATTVTRKTFHVLASLVFLSGIILDVYLTSLAAGIGLGVLIFVEALRKSRIEPISSALQSAFLVYCDEKDCGMVAMTPLYLYVGLAGPLLMIPNGPNRQLELLSGVLSIGVGDTAASWFGSRFGFNKWADSNRTMEGTSFNILSQIATVYTLQLFETVDLISIGLLMFHCWAYAQQWSGRPRRPILLSPFLERRTGTKTYHHATPVRIGFLDDQQALLRTVFASSVSSLVEAHTHQVDNLVLPIITLIAFQLSWLFC